MFQYDPEGLRQGHIRVVTIQPGTDEVECTLSTIPVGTSHIAVSYVWGDAGSSHLMSLNGKPFAVRDNLYTFLRQIRDATSPSQHWWIDAICINQQDLEERSQQVRQMQRIYASAKAVLVWLGRGDFAIEDLFQQIQNLYTHLPDTVGDKQKSLIVNLSIRERVKFFHALRGLSQLPYWSRLWIVPEVFSASYLRLMYGKQMVSWVHVVAVIKEAQVWNQQVENIDQLIAEINYGKSVIDRDRVLFEAQQMSSTKAHSTVHDLTETINTRLQQLDAILDEMGWDRASARRAPTQALLPIKDALKEIISSKLASLATECHISIKRSNYFYDLLLSYGMNSCSDPRDRVFALLTISSDGDLGPVNYNNSAQEVFFQVSERYDVPTDSAVTFVQHLFAALELESFISSSETYLHSYSLRAWNWLPQFLSRLGDDIFYVLNVLPRLLKLLHLDLSDVRQQNSLYEVQAKQLCLQVLQNTLEDIHETSIGIVTLSSILLIDPKHMLRMIHSQSGTILRGIFSCPVHISMLIPMRTLPRALKRAMTNQIHHHIKEQYVEFQQSPQISYIRISHSEIVLLVNASRTETPASTSNNRKSSHLSHVNTSRVDTIFATFVRTPTEPPAYKFIPVSNTDAPKPPSVWSNTTITNTPTHDRILTVPSLSALLNLHDHLNQNNADIEIRLQHEDWNDADEDQFVLAYRRTIGEFPRHLVWKTEHDWTILQGIPEPAEEETVERGQKGKVMQRTGLASRSGFWDL